MHHHAGFGFAGMSNFLCRASHDFLNLFPDERKVAPMAKGALQVFSLHLSKVDAVWFGVSAVPVEHIEFVETVWHERLNHALDGADISWKSPAQRSRHREMMPARSKPKRGRKQHLSRKLALNGFSRCRCENRICEKRKVRAMLFA